MEKILPIVLILIGIGVPMYYTGRNSKPQNVFKQIIKNLQENPEGMWYHYFTKRGMEKWMACEDFTAGKIKSVDILEYNYENYTGKLKTRLNLEENECIYHFHLVKNPDVRAKSRWVISDLYKGK